MTATFVQLDDASVEAVAQRVAELLRGEGLGMDLIDAAEVARRHGVSRDYVYAHADELGAVRVGDGQRPRLRFDPARVTESLAGDADREAGRPEKASRRRLRSPHLDLLPVGPKGDQAHEERG